MSNCNIGFNIGFLNLLIAGTLYHPIQVLGEDCIDCTECIVTFAI